MSTTTPPQKSTVESIPETASFVGVDGDGDRHYVANPITADTIEIHVTNGADVETFDLAETPCIEQDDAIEAWIQHTARKRGDWEYVAYERSINQRLADAGAI